MLIRKDTARTIVIGPILDADGAAKTDEVVASVLASKNGGNPSALNASATLTHKQTGYYLLALTTSDTDTLGCLELSLNSTTNTMPIVRLNVCTAAAWDAFCAASGGAMPADVKAVAGNTYAVAILTGNWGDNATWSAGTPPTAGQNIIIRTGVTVTVAADLDLGTFGSLTLEGNGVVNIAGSKTVAVLRDGWLIENCAGVITTNYGVVRNLTGPGSIVYQRGSVLSVEVLGTVTDNYGTISFNAGTISNNWQGGVVEHNDATISVNYGHVTDNNGTVSTNNGVILYGTGGLFDATITSRLAAASYTAPPSAATVAAAVAAQACGTGEGSIGKAAADAASQTTAANIAAAVWGALTATYAATGSFGKLLGTTWAAVFAGITSLAAWLRAGFRSSTPDATALSEINTGGGTYSATTDSQEAIGTAEQSTTRVSLTVSETTVGTAPEVNIELAQHEKLTTAITAETAQTGDAHKLLVFDPLAPTVALATISSTSSAITIGGSGDKTLTCIISSTATATAGEYRYRLWNVTDEDCVCEGAFAVTPGPDPTT